MMLGNTKDGGGGENSASGANSLTRINFSKFLLITYIMHKKIITIQQIPPFSPETY